MHNIEFRARWREELVASSPEGKLVFELTMGRLHVYFPEEVRWRALAPQWAKDKWQVYVDACREWCHKEKIPISIVSDAHFSEER